MNITMVIPCLLAAGLLQACGLAETTVAAGAAGGSAAQQAQQGRQQMEEVRQDVDLAQQQAAERLKAAEAASQ
jgi:hypothetical protein